MADALTPTEESLAFYHGMALALTQWAHVEDGLFKVALACVAGAENKSLYPAFFGIENFRSKAQFVDRLVMYSDNPEQDKIEWSKSHLPLVNAKATKRNNIVHSIVRHFPGAKSGRRHALCPFIYQDVRTKKICETPPDGSLTVRDLFQCSEEFAAMANRLSNFSARLSGQAEPLPKSSELEKPAPQLGEILRQMTSILPSQRAPSPE